MKMYSHKTRKPPSVLSKTSAAQSKVNEMKLHNQSQFYFVKSSNGIFFFYFDLLLLVQFAVYLCECEFVCHPI